MLAGLVSKLTAHTPHEPSDNGRAQICTHLRVHCDANIRKVSHLLARRHARVRLAVLPDDSALHAEGVLVNRHDLGVGVRLEVPRLQWF